MMGTAAAVAVIMAAGWFLLVAPTRADAADVRVETEGQQAANAQLASKIETYKVQAQDLPAQEAKLAEYRQQIPAQPALPSYIRQLSSIAEESNVVLVAMEPQTPAPLADPAAANAPATADPAAEAGAAPETLDTDPTIGVQFIQTQVTVRGGYFNTEQFLTKLEGLKRAYLVTGFDILPYDGEDAGTGDVETHLQVRIFYSAPLADSTSSTPSTTTATS